jgi:hypothetical protein
MLYERRVQGALHGPTETFATWSGWRWQVQPGPCGIA